MRLRARFEPALLVVPLALQPDGVLLREEGCGLLRQQRGEKGRNGRLLRVVAVGGPERDGLEFALQGAQRRAAETTGPVTCPCSTPGTRAKLAASAVTLARSAAVSPDGLSYTTTAV